MGRNHTVHLCQHLCSALRRRSREMLAFAFRPAGVLGSLLVAGILAYAVQNRHSFAVALPVLALLVHGLYFLFGTVFLTITAPGREMHMLRRLTLGFILGAIFTFLRFFFDENVGLSYIIQRELFLGIVIAVPKEIALLWKHGVWWRLSERLKKRVLWVSVGVTVLVALVQSLTFWVAGVFPLVEFPGTQLMPFLMNIGLLLLAIFGLYLLTNRLVFSLVMAIPAYLFLVLANLLKIQWAHAPIQVLDIFRLSEFLRIVALPYLGYSGCALLALFPFAWLAGLAWSWRHGHHPGLSRERLRVALQLLAMGLPFASFLAFSVDRLCPALRPWTMQTEIFPFKPTINTVHDGTLLYAARELARGDWYVKAPPGYSAATVAECIKRYGLVPENPLPALPRDEKINLITILVESLSDADGLGIHLYGDAMPVIHSMQKLHTSGRAVSPLAGGGSADSEFELLTGMSLHHLPENTCPYNQYIFQNVPSLLWTLKKNGYETHCVFPDSRKIYSRGTLLKYLGESPQNAFWGEELPAWPHSFSERIGKQIPESVATGDDIVIDQVIAQKNKAKAPYYIHAFTISSHCPYDYYSILPSEMKLNVFDAPSEAARQEQTCYFWAIRKVDADIGRLFDSLRHDPRKTVVLVVGDHKPPLTSLPQDLLGQREGEDISSLMFRQRSTPLLVWSNFPMEKEKVTLSMNFLGSYLLERIGITPTGFFRVNASIRRKMPVLSRFVQTASGQQFTPGDAPEEVTAAIDDYRLLQYDLLLGKQYGQDLLDCVR